MLISEDDFLPTVPSDEHERWMTEALKEAILAYRADEVPVGAIIVFENEIIARAHNRRESSGLATAHAELLAIEQACKKLGDWRLEKMSLYVTLEPCPMCAGAIINARIPEVYFGAKDAKAGACHSLYELLDDARLNHRSKNHSGILEEPCSKILTQFFKQKRSKK